MMMLLALIRVSTAGASARLLHPEQLQESSFEPNLGVFLEISNPIPQKR